MSDNYIITDGELYHYGVPGMKWGVRKKSITGDTEPNWIKKHKERSGIARPKTRGEKEFEERNGINPNVGKRLGSLKNKSARTVSTSTRIARGVGIVGGVAALSAAALVATAAYAVTDFSDFLGTLDFSD